MAKLASAPMASKALATDALRPMHRARCTETDALRQMH
jgi:hypothetical protein